MPEPDRFAYQLPAARVVFGAGASADAPGELGRAGLSRPFVVSTPGRRGAVARLRERLHDGFAGSFEGAVLHVPEPTVREALTTIARAGADCCLALGGGSAIGLGKAIAHETALPLVAIPTTYSGSEMTDIWGMTGAHAHGPVKTTGRDPRVRPRLVIYDPELTVSLPPRVSAASGMNAAAHAVEALYAHDGNPMASMLAADALRRFARALPRVCRDPADASGRADCLQAAHFAGLALAMTSMGLQHKLAHVLGGSFGLPHAETHAALLPYVAAYNAEAAPDAMQAIAGALGTSRAPAGLFELAQALGLTASLHELGLAEKDLARAADLAAASSYPNPRPVTPEGVYTLLRAAWSRAAPGS